jgi:rhamnulokinase
VHLADMNSLREGSRLAIDLGAESGRVFLGSLQSNVLDVREVYRFPNYPLTEGNSLHWDVVRLWSEVRTALSSGQLPEIASIGVDAWGVDYALLGESGELLQNPYHYRDPRNVSAMEEVLRLVPRDRIYQETGVQFMPINTLNQLYAAQRDTPELLGTAHRLILIPDLFHYWLSGNAYCEFTAASTTQFANPITRAWAMPLLRELGLPAQLLAPIIEPGSVLGDLRGEISNGWRRTPVVIAPASHDTASAVAAISATGNTAFLSSGTWSLLGIELQSPVISAEALRLNFTNEGGIAGSTRLLKNVMGLWMLQCCRREWSAQGRHFSYDDLMSAAKSAPPFRQLFDPDDPSFLNPPAMLVAVDMFCRRTGQPCPESPGGYVRAILESLSLKYRLVTRNLESLIGRPINRIQVIGGGSKNSLLNQFTADATGKQILSGPSEAAVLGNIGMQMVATGEVSSIRDMRALIDRSFPTDVYEPEDTERWNQEANRFQQYCEFSYA